MFLIFFICIIKTIIKINNSATVIYRIIVNNAVTSTLRASLLRYTYIACLVTFYFIFLTPDGDPFAAVTAIVFVAATTAIRLQSLLLLLILIPVVVAVEWHEF
jgi:hypothetical protein